MKDYEITIQNLKQYKSKACELVNNECENCEAGFEDCRYKDMCCFDEVIRFIEYTNR